METHSHRRLAAILAADIVGYSRMMGADEAGTLFALRRLRDDDLAPAVAAHDGRIVKGLGDGWLVAFESAAAAVRCALAVQDGTTDDAPMRLRMGIHVGDVVFEDGDIYGDGVNVAARLEPLAAPGGVAISQTVWSSLDGTLREHFTDHGPFALKNIAPAVRVFARGGQLSPGTSPGSGAAAAAQPSMSIASFATSAGDVEHAALAEGLADDLETELARFAWLDVVRRDGETGARYQLGGSVRGVLQRVRITAHLTFAPTGRRLWSERWERSIDDPLAVQDELTAAIVSRVAAAIDSQEKSLVAVRPVQTLTARELSLRTNALLSKGQVDVFDEASELIERAVQLEPGNADVHVQKSLVAYRKACSGAWPPRDALHVALEAARRALSLQPRLASGYAMTSVIHGMLGETDRALQAADRVAELNPHAWGAPHGRCVALSFAPPERVGDARAHAQAILDHAEATLRLAPHSAHRAAHLFFRGLGVLMRDGSGQLAAAVEALDRSATEPGASWWPSVFAALAELRGGRPAAARDRIHSARQDLPALSSSSVEALFGGTHVGASWRSEFDLLADVGLPRE